MGRSGTKHGAAPLIGVSWVSAGEEKGERYLRAVTLAGGRAVPLRDAAGLKEIAGLVLTGGGDVDPRLYGEENHGPSAGINRQRDDFEIEALGSCRARQLPVLAICRGFQLVNVALGGSLIQDIAGPIQHHSVRGASSFHEIEVEPDTLLASLLGAERRTRVNSRHHQGVDLRRVAPALRVAALAPDGIVEALEAPGPEFLVAVQCHPEYADQVPQLSGLLVAFIARARARQ